VVSIHADFTVVETGTAALVIGQPGHTVKPRHQQGRTARAHPSWPGLNHLAQGGIKPEPQRDHRQDTPWPHGLERRDSLGDPESRQPTPDQVLACYPPPVVYDDTSRTITAAAQTLDAKHGLSTAPCRDHWLCWAEM